MEFSVLILITLNLLAVLGIAFFLYLKLGQGDNHDLLQARMGETLARSNQDVLKGLNEFLELFRSSQREEFEGLRRAVEGRLDRISQKVQENLNEGFKKTNQTFASVLERLAKIDEAQKKIENLSSNVVSLQDVLTDKKTRGVFGEIQLNQILINVFGEGNASVYEIQKILSNGKIVDALLNLPEPLGSIPVDSKFPLENYKRMVNKTLGEEIKKVAEREFKRDLKKHIDDIANKYLAPKETADQAILFLPAEAVFAEVHAYHSDLVEYAYTQRVWLTSPTTFLATLTTVQTILLNLERNKYMHVIHEEINKLGQEFSRYQERWGDLAKHIGTVSKDVEKINITSNKISDRFQKIMEVEIAQRGLES